MNGNDLVIKLRASFNNHIRPIRIKDKCELCGVEEDLILHHVDTFSNLLDETLEELGINIYCEEFTDLEVKNINNIMLGKQLRSNMATLCDECHKRVHEEGYFKARDKYKPKQPKQPSLEEIKTLEEYLENCVINNIEFLQIKDRTPLIESIGIIDKNHSNLEKGEITYVKNIDTLNSHLAYLELPYEIIQLPRGTTRCKKRYNAIWIVSRLY